MKSTSLAKAIAAFASLTLLGAASAEEKHGTPLNLTQGATDISAEVYDLHMTIFYICCVIGVLVFGVMFYSVFKHRKSKGAVPATFHHSTVVEIIWTAVPLIILISMAIPAAKTLIAMEDSSESEMTVKVTGYQWKWHYEYMGEDVDFYSQLHPDHNAARQLNSGIDVSQFHWYLKEVDTELVLPVGKKIRFLHTAADVIHAWWVPALAVKKDAIPGFINENWALIKEPGVYRGKCAELCGRDHGFMPIVVRAVTQEEFDVWLEKKKAGETVSFEDTPPLVETVETEKATIASPVAVAEVVEQEVPAAEAETVVAEVVAEPAPQQQEAKPVGVAVAAGGAGMEELVSRGKDVYAQQCVACHQAKGQGIPPIFPAITGSAVATGPIAAHIDIVLNGKPGTAMQGFKGRLSDEDIAAVITYQRNGLGNSVGDSVQASELVAN